MKTTLDLPDKLMHAVKVHAVHQRKKLKDAVAELLTRGLAAERAPKLRLPKPLRLRGGPITIDEIEAAISWGRD